MNQSSNSSRQIKQNSSCNEIRKRILSPKCNVENIKNSLRKQFRDRIKQLHNEGINRRRNIADEADKLNILKNIPIQTSGLTSGDILQILEEVENELRTEFLKNECEQYEEDTNNIISRLLEEIDECPICNKVLSRNPTFNSVVKICDMCCNMLNTE